MKVEEVSASVANLADKLSKYHSRLLELERELKLWVRKQIGPIATPDFIQFSPGLPKTRSGKIMRRLLIARELGEPEGDISTLEDD